MAAHPIKLDPDLQERLERAAEREVRSPEFILRDAVEMYFSVRGETDDHTALIADDEAAWNAYDGPTITYEQFLKQGAESLEESRRTGLHLTGEEVADWIRQLQSDPAARLPNCHT